MPASCNASRLDPDGYLYFVDRKKDAIRRRGENISSWEMAYFMVPCFIDFPPDLPRTATEKVQKRHLREQAEQRLHEIWDREKAGIELQR